MLKSGLSCGRAVAFVPSVLLVQVISDKRGMHLLARMCVIQFCMVMFAGLLILMIAWMTALAISLSLSLSLSLDLSLSLNNFSRPVAGLQAQFGNRGLQGGAEGVMSLADLPYLREDSQKKGCAMVLPGLSWQGWHGNMGSSMLR